MKAFLSFGHLTVVDIYDWNQRVGRARWENKFAMVGNFQEIHYRAIVILILRLLVADGIDNTGKIKNKGISIWFWKY
jgi:hypothetical protein